AGRDRGANAPGLRRAVVRAGGAPAARSRRHRAAAAGSSRRQVAAGRTRRRRRCRAGAGAGGRRDRAFRDQRRGGDPGVETVTDAGVVELLLDRRVAVPVIVVRDGTIVSSNEAARELLHGDIGQAIEVLVAADSRSKLAAALAAAPASCE